ncbi:hypothetical protein C8J56DRAFT_896331 [Mycena floridula]|nr:hypothetical protein C8J56DRAFT_896331 [Mycena floridula]
MSPPASNGSAAPQKSAALDAVQIAKLIVQQIPQFQAALQPDNMVSNVPSVPVPLSNNPFAVYLPKSGNTDSHSGGHDMNWDCDVTLNLIINKECGGSNFRYRYSSSIQFSTGIPILTIQKQQS